MGCASVRKDLTAWIESQLPRRRTARIEQHLTACPACAAEGQSLRAAIRSQRVALRAATALDDVDTVALRAALRRGIAAQAEDADDGMLWRTWSSLWGRVALVGAAAAVAAILLVSVGGPGMILIPLGVESPPAAVVRQTELFKDYPLIEQLDVLENFDTVESVPLDDDSTSQQG